MLTIRVCRHLPLTLCLLLLCRWAGASEVFYDARVGTGASIAPTCSVVGAQVIAGGNCQGYSGYSASISNPAFSPYGSIPFNQALRIDSSAGTLNSSALTRAVIPEDGSLAGFRVTADRQVNAAGPYQINSWGYLDLRITERISFEISSDNDGQDVHVTVNVPYDGSYSGFQGGGVREDAYTYGELVLNVFAENGGLIADDVLTLGYAPTTVNLAGVLTSGPTLIRSALSSDREVFVDVAMNIRAGLVGGANFYDVDFLNTLYFDIDMPRGVTADLGVFANREQSTANGVPEPGALSLFALGLVGLAVTRRRPA